MGDLALSVSGFKYSGWQSVSVLRSIESLASSFNVNYVERWSELSEPLPIVEGDSVEVYLDDELVLTGYVDDPNLSYDAENHGGTLAGRSKTGDIVDCSAIYPGSSWKNSNIEAIAQDLCAPFNIGVLSQGSLGAKFKKFALQDGEAVYETLERAAKMRALMMLTNPDGSLLITRQVGSRKVSGRLERGVNILGGTGSSSGKDRFSSYTIKAQIPGDDSTSGENTIIKRTVEDSNVNRYRPLIISAENEDSGKELRDRAIWERNRRAGRARRITYRVEGWHDQDGRLWEPNTLVDVRDDWLRVKQELLIVSVRYSKSEDEGSITQLELCRKEAFDLVEFPPPKPKDQGEDFFAT